MAHTKPVDRDAWCIHRLVATVVAHWLTHLDFLVVGEITILAFISPQSLVSCVYERAHDIFGTW